MPKPGASLIGIRPLPTGSEDRPPACRALARALGCLLVGFAIAFSAPASASDHARSGADGGHLTPGEHEQAERTRVPGSPPEEGPLAATVDVVSGARTVHAEPRTPTTEEEPELEESDPRETHSTSVIAEVEYRFSERLRLGARTAVSTAGFMFSTAGEERATSFGNVEIAPQYGGFVMPGLRMAFELGLGLPTATGDEFSASVKARRLAHTNLAAARFRGYHDNALFAAHRIGVAPKVLIESRGGWIDVDAYAKFELLARAGGTSPPPEWRIEGQALEAIVGAHAAKTYGLFGIGGRAWAAYTMVGEVKALERPGHGDASPLQLMVEPQVLFATTHVRATLGALVPIGGRLGEWRYFAGRFAFTVDI